MEFKKLEIVKGIGKGENEYFVYDEDGEYICNCLDIEIAEEIVKRVNEYEELKKENKKLQNHVNTLKDINEFIKAQNEELEKDLKENMILPSRIEDLESINREAIELLKLARNCIYDNTSIARKIDKFLEENVVFKKVKLF